MREDKSSNNNIVGTNGSDIFHGGPNSVLFGGEGDDVYYLWDATSDIVEAENEGVDTAYASYWGDVTLFDNVENLYLMTAGSTKATGNALDNSVHAGTIGATLNGLAGNDFLYGGNGADLFQIEAGNGSDIINNFTSGFDVLSLRGYDFTNFSQIQASASQIDDDVVIAMTNGETLTLRGSLLSGLVGADFGFSNVGDAVPTGYTSMSGAGKTIVQNGVYVANNVWNPGTYVEGEDYAIDSYWTLDNLTDGTTFNWSFPTTTDLYAPVRAYPEIIFGVSPWGDVVNETDVSRTFPVKVSDIRALKADYDTSYSGNTAGFNMSYDIWLTSVPNGDASTVTNEIMVWTHKNEFAPWGDMIGTFSDGAFTGKIYHTGTYTAIILDQDVPTGTLDLVAVFGRLEELGIVSDAEWLASVQYGAEVISGVGSLTINKLELTLTTVDSAGEATTRHIDGTGSGIVAQEPPAGAIAAPPFQAIYDDHGLLTGYKEMATDDVGDTMIKWYDRGGNLVLTDTIKIPPNGNVFTEHRDASGQSLGIDGIIYNDNGTITTARYDADHILLGWDIATDKADGSVSITSYTNMGVVTGTQIERIDGTTTTVEYLDASGQSTSSQATVLDPTGSGSQTIYDAANHLVSSATYTVVDGALTTRNYDANGELTGGTVKAVDQDGILIETTYGREWNLVDTSYIGHRGSNTIILNDGVHFVHGNGGGDNFVAGIGTDHFYFESALTGVPDMIRNFEVGTDKLHIDRHIFLGLGPSGALAASAFTIGAAATEESDRIVYDSNNGNLFYDADGSGAEQAVLFAHLNSDMALSQADFVVI